MKNKLLSSQSGEMLKVKKTVVTKQRSRSSIDPRQVQAAINALNTQKNDSLAMAA